MNEIDEAGDLVDLGDAKQLTKGIEGPMNLEDHPTQVYIWED